LSKCENTAVISGLKVTLDTSKADTKDTLSRIHKRIDEQAVAIGNISVDIARIDTKFDKSLMNQTEMASKINKTLLIVDGMPHNSNFSAKDSGENGKE
jgi:hypothetical protein